MDIEYLAGFIDADGCVTRHKHNGREYWEINATQCEANGLEPLQEMQQRWGGTLYKIKKAKDHHSQVWRWKSQGIEAAIAMNDMYFHFVTKRNRVQEALEYLVQDPKIARILYRIGEPPP